MNWTTDVLLSRFALPRGWKNWTAVKNASSDDAYAARLYKVYVAVKQHRWNATVLRQLPDLQYAARLSNNIEPLLNGDYSSDNSLIQKNFSSAGKMLFLTDFVVDTPFGSSVLAVFPGLDPECSPFYGVPSSSSLGELHHGVLYRTDVFRGYDGFLYWGDTSRVSRDEASELNLSYHLYEVE